MNVSFSIDYLVMIFGIIALVFVAYRESIKNLFRRDDEYEGGEGV